jgi:hypothetical protein
VGRARRGHALDLSEVRRRGALRSPIAPGEQSPRAGGLRRGPRLRRDRGDARRQDQLGTRPADRPRRRDRRRGRIEKDLQIRGNAQGIGQLPPVQVRRSVTLSPGLPRPVRMAISKVKWMTLM